MEGELGGLITVFEGIVSDVLGFVTDLLPILVPVLLLGIGIPLGIRMVRSFSRIRG